MGNTEYLRNHHHITESYLGLIRIHLSRGDIQTAKHCADQCCNELDNLLKNMMNSQYGVQDD